MPASSNHAKMRNRRGQDGADLMQVILQSHPGTVEAVGGGENQTILKRVRGQLAMPAHQWIQR